MSKEKFSRIVGLIVLKENCSISQAIVRAQILCGLGVTDLLMMFGRTSS